MARSPPLQTQWAGWGGARPAQKEALARDPLLRGVSRAQGQGSLGPAVACHWHFMLLEASFFLVGLNASGKGMQREDANTCRERV